MSATAIVTAGVTVAAGLAQIFGGGVPCAPQTWLASRDDFLIEVNELIQVTRLIIQRQIKDCSDTLDARFERFFRAVGGRPITRFKGTAQQELENLLAIQKRLQGEQRQISRTQKRPPTVGTLASIVPETLTPGLTGLLLLIGIGLVLARR